ncbi:hypothetical protein NC796_16930 [Aliifodinibius sp. S!AR15-10]|uniref:hypothetical protein n=1 Tax=Aliifodinibius sp. S!AR15-10 TaxID=2950437 RepID=UPI002857AF97|nr:hypothetical protein [Aliifodinibius sp. S!AR15-10]MDR8392843.1 hypothetical protein [Aliifodinibius sp. S!AR15-10]
MDIVNESVGSDAVGNCSILENRNSSHLVGKSKAVDRYEKLKALNKLQKRIVRQNMHSAMSPISAISGYLELMNVSLDNNVDVERIQRYREKIESGIDELNAILEHLHKTFSEEKGENNSRLGMNLLIEETTLFQEK